jgi:FKBP-type peptidyl-prolyl cis-trans isomerase
MKIGGVRQLVIPPSLGYGPNDYGPIPGNSVLVFNVQAIAKS